MNIKLLLGKLLCHPTIGTAILRTFRGRIPSRGFVIDIRSDRISLNAIASIFWGLYERNEIKHFYRFLRRDLDIIEFGSGIGVTSIHISKIQNKERRLLCVEANPYLVDSISKNMKLNAPPDKEVQVFNKALDYSGQARVDMRIDTGVLGSHVASSQEKGTISIDTITLAELVNKYGFGEFALVADVEGAEAGMILEEGETLAQCQQMIIELHPAVYAGQSYSVSALCEVIQSAHGFRLVAQRHNVYVFEKG